MLEAESTVEIAKPPADVFAHLRDAEHMSKWVTHLVKGTAPLASPAGTKLQLEFREMGSRTRVADTEILEFEEARKLALKMSDRSFDIVIRFSLEPAGTGTRVTYRMEATPKSAMMRFTARLGARAAKRQQEEELARLKALAETPAVASPST